MTTIPERIEVAWASLAKRVEADATPASVLHHLHAWLHDEPPLASIRMQELILERPALLALLEHGPRAFRISEQGVDRLVDALLRGPALGRSPGSLTALLDSFLTQAIAAPRGRCHHCGVGTLLVFHRREEDRLYLVCDELYDRFTLDGKRTSVSGQLLPATDEQLRRLEGVDSSGRDGQGS